MKRRHTTSSVAAFLSGVAAVLNIVLLASADVSVQPFRRASSAVARHLSPVELNEKILSSVPPPMITTSADDHAKTVRDQRHHQQRHHHHHHQERRYSHIAVFRRALSAASTRKQGLSRPGTVSALTTAANVAATICPPGMLPLAYGMAAAHSSGPLVACTILLLFGLLAWYSLVSLARAAEVMLVQQQQQATTTSPLASFGTQQEDYYGQSSIAAVWGRTMPKGRTTTFIPDIGCLGLTAGCLLVYSAYIGDLVASLIAQHVRILPPLLTKRWCASLLLHGTVILPLCLFRGEDRSMQPQHTSWPGLIGIVYVLFFVVTRFLDKSYHSAGTFFGHSHSPLMSRSRSPIVDSGKGLFVLMTMSSLAYACHYNGVKYYMELKNRKLLPLRKTMAMGVGGASLFFMTIMVLSFATFGQKAQVLLLNNYHPTGDSMATTARLMIAVSLIFGYSFVFEGLKTSLFSLFKLAANKDNSIGIQKRRQGLPAFVLALIFAGSCFVTDQGIAAVIGVVGSIFGSIVVYIFPAIVNSSLLKMTDRSGNPLIEPLFPGEAIFNQGLFAFGVVFAALGSRLLTHPKERFRI